MRHPPRTWVERATRSYMGEPGAEAYWGEPCVRVGQPLGNRWQVEMEFVLRDGRPVVSELHIYAPPPILGAHLTDLKCPDPQLRAELQDAAPDLPPQGLTGRDLRRLMLWHRAWDIEEAWRDLPARGVELFPESPPVRHIGKKRRGRPLSDEIYAQLSEDYIAASRRRPRDPLIAMVEEYRKRGDRGTSPELLRDRIRLARRYGWLPPAGKRGVPGPAEPGPRLHAWLEEKAQSRQQRKTRRTPKEKEER